VACVPASQSQQWRCAHSDRLPITALCMCASPASFKWGAGRVRVVFSNPRRAVHLYLALPSRAFGFEA